MADLSRRRFALGASALSLAAASGFPAPALAAPLRYDLAPVEVADGVFLLEGAREYFSPRNGGNIVNVALLRTDEGVVVFDTGPSARYGEALRQTAERVGGTAPHSVVISHFHPDHYLGNQAFTDRPIRSLGAVNARIAAEGGMLTDNMYRLLGDWMRGTVSTPPDATLTPGTHDFAGRRVTIIGARGHTDADLALFDHATGTLIAGDLVFYDRAPTTPHADLGAWRQALDALAAQPVRTLIPGHGPASEGIGAIQQTRAYLDWLETTLIEAAERGLTMTEVMALPIPARFERLAVARTEFARSVSHLYPRFEQRAMPYVNL